MNKPESVRHLRLVQPPQPVACSPAPSRWRRWVKAPWGPTLSARWERAAWTFTACSTSGFLTVINVYLARDVLLALVNFLLLLLALAAAMCLGALAVRSEK